MMEDVFVAHCTVDNNDTIVIGVDMDGDLVIEATEGITNRGLTICLDKNDAIRLVNYLIDAGFGRRP